MSRLGRHNRQPANRVRGRGPRADRGAVLVHVAVAMTGLLAFSALSIDLGTLWVSRAQAQNVADAAALSGAIAMGYGTPESGNAIAAAKTVAQQHVIWGEPVANASLDVQVGECPTGAPATPGPCVRAGVRRDVASGTPLPVFFSRMFGVAAKEVAATASAKVLLGNTAPCPRPLAVVDRWTDAADTTAPVDARWTTDDVFDGFDGNGNPAPPGADTYVAPSLSGPGSGISVGDFAGQTITRTIIDPSLGLPIGGDQMVALDLPRSGSEHLLRPDRYEANITSCGASPLAIGDPATAFNVHSWEYTYRGMRTLLLQDPGASWDGNAVVGSAFQMSPRLMTLALFDPDAYSRRPRLGQSEVSVTITNLIGFFLVSVDQNAIGVQISGVVVPMEGRFTSTSPQVDEQAGFLRTVALVR